MEPAIISLGKNKGFLLGLIAQHQFTASALSTFIIRKFAKGGNVSAALNDAAKGNLFDTSDQNDFDYFQYLDEDGYQAFISTTLLGLPPEQDLEEPVAKRVRYS